MKKILLILSIYILCAPTFSQTVDTLSGVISANPVNVAKTGKRKEAIDAALRAKAKQLTRDLIENHKLQFEPEYARYHGIYINMNSEKYTKTFTNKPNSNTVFGGTSGWHEDDEGGEFSGKPRLQIINGRFYSNLDVILKEDKNKDENNKAKKTAVTRINFSERGSTDSPTPPSNSGINEVVPITNYDSDEEEEEHIYFNTKNFTISNFESVNEYITTFDITVDQISKIDETEYDTFTFQCAINILDARMAVRIIAGKNRICATYHGDMNYVRGNSF